MCSSGWGEQVPGYAVTKNVDPEVEVEILVFDFELEDGHGVHHAAHTAEHDNLNKVPILVKHSRENAPVKEAWDSNDEENVAQDAVQEDEEELVEEMFVVHLIADMHQDRKSQTHQKVGRDFMLADFLLSCVGQQDLEMLELLMRILC